MLEDEQGTGKKVVENGRRRRFSECTPKVFHTLFLGGLVASPKRKPV